jgi:ubiquinone/menaquinone biosynthesis C-methylase UbiE
MLPFSPALMQEMMGGVSLQVARQSLKYVPPLTSSSNIHDNGCSNDVVTAAIMETVQPGTFAIHATDVSAPLCQATTALAASKGWGNSVKAEVMPAEALTFPDNTFTHSFNNFLIFLVKDPEKTASEIYRTLKPGGVAIVSTWASMPLERAVLEAHTAPRGPDACHAYQRRQEWKTVSRKHRLCSFLERHGDKLLSVFSLASNHMGWHGIIHGGIISGMFDDIFARYCYSEGAEAITLTKMFQVEYIKPVCPDETMFARIAKASPPRDNTGKRSKKLWVQGSIETIRDDKVTTLVKTQALFILCDQLLPEPKRKAALPCPDRSYKRMPQELWEMVIVDLPSLSGSYAAEAFGFRLQERHRKHSNIWKMIFRVDEKWTPIARRQGIKLVLVGDNLHALYNDPMQPAYLALVTGDKTKTIRHDKAKLLVALQPHRLNKNNEIVFHESRIVLNIDDAIHNPFFITSTPKKLFGYCEHGKLRSASLYLQDSEYALRTIRQDDIVGPGERVSTLQDVSLICGITLTHPIEMELRQRYQQCFQYLCCPPAYPLCPKGYKFNGDNILGWQWEDENPSI